MDWGWFVLIQKTRATIGLPNPEEELRCLEEQANATWGKYQEALNVTAQLNGSMDNLKAEIEAMGKQLAEEQGNISVYTDRQTKATATKVQAEAELKDAQAVLSSEENSRIALAAEVKAHSGSVGVVKKEIEDIELAIAKVELEKGNRDHTIMVLQDEIAEQDEVINKLNKEKKHIAETQAKSNDDMVSVGEKVDHLAAVKSKLESTLGELESSLDKEKKSRATVEKEKNNAQLAAKLDDEQNLVAKAQKGIKEIQGRVENMEEELEAERQARAKAERQRSDLAREIDQLGERLDEASGATTAQVELNKKREAEVNKLRKDVEEANIQQESILSNLKRKQGDATAEMTEQIDALGKMKSKIEKDKVLIMNEIADARAATDEVMRAQASADMSNKKMLETLNAINKKVDDANLTLGDFASNKNKISCENSDLLRIVGDLDNNLNILAKQKAALAAQLNDVKALCDNEARERGLLLGKYRNLEHELDGARCALGEEAAGRENTLRLVAKAESESQCWRQKYETDAVAKGEELEMTKMKLTARLTEAEAAIDNLNAKLNQVEKAKGKIASEISEMTSSLDQAQVLNAAMDRKAKQFDKVIGEWKGKVDRLSYDLDVSQKETRNASSELFKVKSAYEETMLQLEEVHRENKTLSNEIKDIMDQISEGGRSIHEIDKIRKRLEAEKLELQSALEEAEGALEQEENKVLRMQMELSQVKQEIERRIAEKEEEFENTRKNHARAMDSIQASMESEQKAKTEALRIKKKLEGDINELEIAVDQANKANSEANKAIKRYQGQLRDSEVACSEEAKARAELQGRANLSDRRANALQGECEEARALLDSAERGKRQVEAELGDSRNAVSEMSAINTRASAAKRQVEGEVHTLHAEIDQMLLSAKSSEEKAKKAMVDASRLADELRAEQDHTNGLSKTKKSLETQLQEMEGKIADAEESAIRGGRAILAKMESRIREMEIELGSVQAHTSESLKSYQRSERKNKELAFQIEEDKKNQQRMSELATALQNKIKSYKKQIEDAEEIAALNLAKFRKAQQEYEESEERAKLAENQLSTTGGFF